MNFTDKKIYLDERKKVLFQQFNILLVFNNTLENTINILFISYRL